MDTRAYPIKETTEVLNSYKNKKKLGIDDLNDRNQIVLESEQFGGILSSEKYCQQKYLKRLEGLPKEVPMSASIQPSKVKCNLNEKSPQMVIKPQLRNNAYRLKKKVFLKSKCAKIETKIRPFQYEKKRLRNCNKGLGSIEKALPALRNQLMTSSNTNDVIKKSRWPHSI